MVVEVLLARDELLAVRRREEEAAALVVAEELDREERKPARLLEPARLARRDVQLVQPVRDVGVVVEEAGVLRDAVAVGAVEAALGRRQRPEQELAEPPRRVEPVVALQAASGLGERGEREPVPGGDRLVVAQRLRPLLAPLEQLALQLRRQLAAQDEPSVLERLEELLRHALLGRPREREPLDAVGVRVLRRREPALRAARARAACTSTVSSTISR